MTKPGGRDAPGRNAGTEGQRSGADAAFAGSQRPRAQEGRSDEERRNRRPHRSDRAETGVVNRSGVGGRLPRRQTRMKPRQDAHPAPRA